MFELLHILQTDHFPHIVRLCNFFADYAIRCGKGSIVRNRTSTQFQKPCFVSVYPLLNLASYLSGEKHTLEKNTPCQPLLIKPMFSTYCMILV